MTNEERQKVVDRALTMLSEVCDASQVLICWYNPEDFTSSQIYSGRGLWQARMGMAEDFRKCEQSAETASQIARKINPPDDDWKQ